MKFTTSSVVAAVAGLSTLAFAAPAYKRTDLTPFFLVIESTDNRVAGQCVFLYHTGAGLSDASISECGPAPAKDFTFGNNKLSFTAMGPSNEPAIPATVSANGGGIASYDNWAAVTINAGDEGSDFMYTTDLGFVQLQDGQQGLGFVACQWAHFGQWQLFALSEADPVILPNCAKVTVKQGCYNTDAGCVNNVIV